MTTLSVVTIALNEEHNLQACLESVSWADELVVVDSGSTDGTLAIAKQFTDKAFNVEWLGYGATKNFALRQTTGRWVLWLDADERVTEELAAEIKAIVAGDGKPRHAAYDVARRAYFLGKWIKHSGWYPARIVRLFLREKGAFSENRVHEHLLVEGSVGELRHDLLHYTDPDLRHYFVKFNRYTSLAAEDLHAAGRRFSVYDLLVRPPFLFLKMYIVRAGFLDGIRGFILAVLSSAYVFVKYAKLWELYKNERRQ